MTDHADNKVPEIRFGGFEGQWNDIKLGEITTKIGSGKTPRGGKSCYLSDGILLLRSQNVLHDVVEIDGAVFISENTDEEMSNSRVLENDVLLNITGASIGRSAVYRLSERANVNQHVCIIRPCTGHNSDFIQLNLTSTWGQKAIDSSQAGGGREGLNFQQIAKFRFDFPSWNEQNHIGTYFKSMDRMIALHQRKHDKLTILKQAMLQKMFPQDGATTPEIRFKGLEGDWVETAFGVFAPRATQSSVDKSLPRLEYEDIVSGAGHLNKNIWKKRSSKTGIRFESGDVLFGKLRPYLKNWILADFEGVAVGDFWVLRSPTTVSSFLYCLIQTSKFEYIANQSAGSKMPRSDWTLVSNTLFLVPSDIEEQEKIGTYFLNLDKLIFQHATQLSKLKNIKSACLEKMFV